MSRQIGTSHLSAVHISRTQTQNLAHTDSPTFNQTPSYPGHYLIWGADTTSQVVSWQEHLEKAGYIGLWLLKEIQIMEFKVVVLIAGLFSPK